VAIALVSVDELDRSGLHVAVQATCDWPKRAGCVGVTRRRLPNARSRVEAALSSEDVGWA